MLSIFREAIDQLPMYRADPELWIRCAYSEFVHPEYGKQDANTRERYRRLIALQYDHHPADESLVRYLFDQEVIARSKDDFQGFGDALRLVSYLLSRWRRGSDLWRFAAAKCANFDTYCGYDSQFLFAVGRDAALAEFANSDHELKDEIKQFLFDEQGDCHFSSAEIEDWQRALVEEFSKRPEDEPLMVWIDRAMVFEICDEGLLLLDRLEASETNESLSSLSYLREQLGDLKGAIKHRRAMLDMAQDEWDRASNACCVAKLLLKDGRPDEAWILVRGFDDYLPRIDGWHTVGLGRSIVAVAFQIATTASPDVARMGFEWACRHESQLETSWLHLLRLATEAAIRLDDSVRAKHYQAAADAEQRRIDEVSKKH